MASTAKYTTYPATKLLSAGASHDKVPPISFGSKSRSKKVALLGAGTSIEPDMVLFVALVPFG
jgi:hypothetical protein